VYFRPENLQHAAFDTEHKVRRYHSVDSSLQPRCISNILSIYSMLSGLEAALEDLLYNFKSTTFKTPPAPKNNRSQYAKRKRVHSLEMLRRKTLYGMHMESYLFIRVNLYDPNDIKRVAAILEVSLRVPVMTCNIFG